MKNRKIKRRMDTEDKALVGCFGLWFGFCAIVVLVVAFVIIHFVAKVW